MGKFSNFYFLIFPIFIFKLEDVTAVSCKETSYNLKQSRFVHFASPNYPRKFEPQTQCNWLLIAPVGYRVKIKFVSFYLVGGQVTSRRLDCMHQKLQMNDLLSGKIDGPYCGNTPPPSLVSTGRMIRVKLQSDALNTNQYYKGFQIKAIASKEASSVRLRDSAGRWLKYSISEEVDPMTSLEEALSPDYTVPPPPQDGDNNNEAIEARNKMVNFQNNMRSLEEGHSLHHPIRPNIVTPRRVVKTKPRTQRRRRIITTSSTTTMKTPSHNKHSHGHNDDELPHGVIIVIALAAMMLLALTFAACNYCKRRRLAKEEKSEERREAMTLQIPLPVVKQQVTSSNSRRQTYHSTSYK